MKEFDDVKIKELIGRFPDVENVLLEYDIDCLHCKKGSCRLRDIIEAEGLTMEEEIEFMSKISTAISSGN
jgi:hypothetical protein